MNMERQSPFKISLYTNDVLSDAECGRVRDFLAGPQVEAEVLTQEIIRLQAQLDDLTATRNQLNEFIHSHLALVSPVRRLPDDILREIFIASLPSKGNATLRASDTPILLCHVTRRWRNLALSTPRLWATLHIIGLPVMQDNTRVDRMNDAANAWLSRSGALPLSISFVQGRPFFRRVDSNAMELHRSACKTFLDTLIKFAPRWGSVRFSIAQEFDITPLAEVAPEDVKMLRSAAIDRWDDGIPFLGAHGLRALSLQVAELPASLPIHWESLCHLTLVSAQNDQMPAFNLVLPALRQCSRLENLSVDFHFTMDPQPHPPCDLPHLRQLSVGGTAWGLVCCVNAPQLRILSCVLHRVPSLETPNPLVRLASRSNHLECLRLELTAISGDTLMAVLRAVPTLRELTLRGEPRTPGALRQRDGRLVSMLTPNPTSTTICPQLQRLKLLSVHAFSDEDLLAFVLARTHPNIDAAPDHITHLKEIAVQFDRRSQVDILPTLDLQIAAGLKVSLLYQQPQHNLEVYLDSRSNDSSYVWDPSAHEWDMPDVNGLYGHA
ncbi:hypothetical protein FB45DRAFT_838530 [Roridomyces roridus]|uniref:F-box domain-containing protein n=1 Tax=Roridomyces roridus TaxID=1738132 RepID=A0AAD7BJF5_9AGAR|nr:hypothetical protein FB45DRAFT_838530 [Roridomyces roridus]